jgi:hypothetical protein
LIIEGAKEKVLKFKMPISQFPTETLVPSNKNVFMSTLEGLKIEKYL